MMTSSRLMACEIAWRTSRLSNGSRWLLMDRMVSPLGRADDYFEARIGFRSVTAHRRPACSTWRGRRPTARRE